MGTVGGRLEQRDEGNGHEVGPVDVGHVGFGPVGVLDVVVEVLLEFGCGVTLGCGLAGCNTSVCSVGEELVNLGWREMRCGIMGGVRAYC